MTLVLKGLSYRDETNRKETFDEKQCHNHVLKKKSYWSITKKKKYTHLLVWLNECSWSEHVCHVTTQVKKQNMTQKHPKALTLFLITFLLPPHMKPLPWLPAAGLHVFKLYVSGVLPYVFFLCLASCLTLCLWDPFKLELEAVTHLFHCCKELCFMNIPQYTIYKNLLYPWCTFGLFLPFGQQRLYCAKQP